MPDLRAQKDKAAELAARGKLERAAEVYREVLGEDPRDAATRQRLAEVLRRWGRIGEAVTAYSLVADQYGREGQLAKAIALCKTILEPDPAHRSTQGVLAGLYAKKERAEDPYPRPPLPSKAEAREHPLSRDGEGSSPLVLSPSLVPEAPTPLSQILLAAQAALAEHGLGDLELRLEDDGHDTRAEALARPALVGAAPSTGVEGAGRAMDLALPRVPIFSDLSREAFIALAHGMVLHRILAGEVVVREGERGESFYVVAAGHLLVTKRDETGEVHRLARLGEGDFFGEMALLAGTPRLATVTAEVDAEILEIRAEVLLDLAGRFPHLATSLRRFQRQRLLANAMAVSPVFRPFSREDRRDVVTRFRTREVSAGEVIIREGQPSDGLYVVLGGAFVVTRQAESGRVDVAELREGDVFGEMSCLTKSAATATVTARRAGALLRLPREGFDELVSSHPQVLEVVSDLTEERRENLDAILSGRAQWTEEGLVLI